MNTHVPAAIKYKYPQFEFRGKPKIIKDRTIIEAYNPTTDMKFHYSFEEDFFWFAGQIPEYKLPKL